MRQGNKCKFKRKGMAFDGKEIELRRSDIDKTKMIETLGESKDLKNSNGDCDRPVPFLLLIVECVSCMFTELTKL